jgi:hypothetical protein
VVRIRPPLPKNQALTETSRKGFFDFATLLRPSCNWRPLALLYLNSHTDKQPVTLKGTWSGIKHIMLPLICILTASGFMHGIGKCMLASMVTNVCDIATEIEGL